MYRVIAHGHVVTLAVSENNLQSDESAERPAPQTFFFSSANDDVPLDLTFFIYQLWWQGNSRNPEEIHVLG